MNVKKLFENVNPEFGTCIGVVQPACGEDEPNPDRFLYISESEDIQIVRNNQLLHTFAPCTVTEVFVPQGAGNERDYKDFDVFPVLFCPDCSQEDLEFHILPKYSAKFLDIIRRKHPNAVLMFHAPEDYFDISVGGMHAALYQMFMAERHENLVFCIASGKSHPDYPLKMMLACQKFQFIGGLCWTVGEKKRKVRKRDYERFFDSWCESVEEMTGILKDMGLSADPVDVLEKYRLIRAWCLPLLYSTEEAYAAGEYRNIIEWIIENDDVPFPPGDDDRTVINSLPIEFCGENDFEYGNFMN